MTEKTLDKMTVKELREVAKTIDGLTGVHAMKKDALLAAIKAGREEGGGHPSAPRTQKRAAVAHQLATKDEIKAAISRLRDEKAAMKESGSRKEVAAIRRQIKRLKRQTRKIAVRPVAD